MLAKRLFSLIVMIAFLAGCGFQIRGLADLSFKSINIKGSSSVIRDLKKSLAVNGVKSVDDEEDAELMLEIMNDATEKRILSLSGTGVVREYDLIYRLVYRIKSPKDELWSDPKTIETRRDFTYTDRDVLASGYEEQRLNNEMRQESTQQLVRSLVTFKPNK